MKTKITALTLITSLTVTLFAGCARTHDERQGQRYDNREGRRDYRDDRRDTRDYRRDDRFDDRRDRRESRW